MPSAGVTVGGRSGSAVAHHRRPRHPFLHLQDQKGGGAAAATTGCQRDGQDDRTLLRGPIIHRRRHRMTTTQLPPGDAGPERRPPRRGQRRMRSPVLLLVRLRMGATMDKTLRHHRYRGMRRYPRLGVATPAATWDGQVGEQDPGRRPQVPPRPPLRARPVLRAPVPKTKLARHPPSPSHSSSPSIGERRYRSWPLSRRPKKPNEQPRPKRRRRGGSCNPAPSWHR